jgi:hypothetical protein
LGLTGGEAVSTLHEFLWFDSSGSAIEPDPEEKLFAAPPLSLLPKLFEPSNFGLI